MNSLQRSTRVRASQENIKQDSAGFTVLELLISTAVFSVVLLLCATAIVQVGRMYYKSIIQVRTMDANRAISDDITQALQFGERSNSFYGTGTLNVVSGTYGNVTVNSYCLGSVRYSFVLVAKSLGKDTTNQLPHVLWKDRGGTSACVPLDLTQSTPSPQGQELLGTDMRLSVFNVAPPIVGGVPFTSGIWTINTTVAYGSTTDLFIDPLNPTVCVGNVIGGQYCAVSTISTNVIKRL